MNRQGDIERIYRYIGEPTLETKDLFRGFTRIVAAVFAFGFEPLHISGESGWGLRRNSTGTTSADTLRFRNQFAVDIAPGSGRPVWSSQPISDRFHWLVFTPSDEGFGIGIADAHPEDLPLVKPEDVVTIEPPTEPPLMPDSHFDHAWWRQLITNLNQLYAEELGRELIMGPMYVELDVEGLSLRLFQLLEARWSLQMIRDDIRRSSEWADKHPDRDVFPIR